MNLEKIIDHLMSENEFLRTRLDLAEKETKARDETIESLQYDIDALYKRNRSKKVKKEALKRDGYSCVKCGSKNRLHVHHVIPLSKQGKDILSNVETLCIECHIDAHDGERAATFLASNL
jgi:predicted HNH restriction endonuclease